jgi:hypothetical protein
MIKTSDTAAGDIVEISLPTGGPYGIVFAADTDGYDCIIICLNASKSISFLQILPSNDLIFHEAYEVFLLQFKQ